MIVGNLKVALLVLVSLYLYSAQLEAINVAGIVVTISAFFLYSYVQKSRPNAVSQPSDKAKLRQDSASESDTVERNPSGQALSSRSNKQEDKVSGRDHLL